MVKKNVEKIFSHPFHREYWRLALAEFKDVRMLILAAVVIAARVAVGAMNPLRLPPDIKINLSFWFVAVGAMIYGPVVAFFSGAVSDTISCALIGFEGYFFPYIFVEMLGGFLAGIFLYRLRLSTGRVILSRVAVAFGCNLLVNPMVTILQYWILRVGAPYTMLKLTTTLFKNLLLLPLEALILVLFVSAVVPPLKAVGMISKEQPKIYMQKSHYIILAVLLLLGIAVLVTLFETGFYDWFRKLLTKWMG